MSIDRCVSCLHAVQGVIVIQGVPAYDRITKAGHPALNNHAFVLVDVQELLQVHHLARRTVRVFVSGDQGWCSVALQAATAYFARGKFSLASQRTTGATRACTSHPFQLCCACGCCVAAHPQLPRVWYDFRRVYEVGTRSLPTGWSQTLSGQTGAIVYVRTACRSA